MKNQFTNARLLFLSVLILLLVAACSSGGGEDDGDDGTPPPTPSIAEIIVDADPDSINVTELSAITASVYDQSGSPVSGAQVSFSLDKPSLAAISPSIATTDGSGVAHATLSARSQQGTVIIKAGANEGQVISNEKTLSILSGVSPDKINVTANPNTILVEGTTGIMAEVLDQTGNPVPDGTAVSFEVSNPNFGELSADSGTTLNGFASSTFIAANQPGIATIEVSVGNINNSVDVLINQSQPASLEFVSADPQRISIAGAGGIQTSEIKFKVIDENGNPVSGISVLMNLAKGPNGGESIDNDDTPHEIEVSSDADGIAKVILQSGSTAGPVTIQGAITIEGVTFTTNSSVVSIGGGVPSASRFSVAASVLNIPGLDLNNKTTDITAYMSDRYGNYNILKGTTVSFWSEPALAVDASTATVNEDGLATVTARTQHPTLDVNTGGKNVQPFAWENNLSSYVSTTYGWSGSTHPRDGLVSVLVYTQGEEHFDDLNANGLYDSNEPFLDTHDDPFLDYNDNGGYNYLGVDPAEIFNDVNGSGTWDDENDEWDSQKDIFHNFKILITGEPIIAITPTTFVIPNGGSQFFTFIVADRNLNYLSAGTKISVSIDGGGKLFAGEVTMDDSSFLPGEDGSWTTHLSRIEHNATIYDDKTDEDEAPKVVTLTVKVEWEGNTEEITIAGTLD